MGIFSNGRQLLIALFLLQLSVCADIAPSVCVARVVWNQREEKESFINNIVWASD